MELKYLEITAGARMRAALIAVVFLTSTVLGSFPGSAQATSDETTTTTVTTIVVMPPLSLKERLAAEAAVHAANVAAQSARIHASFDIGCALDRAKFARQNARLAAQNRSRLRSGKTPLQILKRAPIICHQHPDDYSAVSPSP